MLPIIFMTAVLCNYFHTIEYQEISEILQFHVFDKTDSKKFADMHMKFELKFTHNALKKLVKDVDDLATIKDKLLNFVETFFVEEDDRQNIPFLVTGSDPDFVKDLDEQLKEVFTLIHEKWYIYARRDSFSNTDKFEEANDTLKIKSSVDQNSKNKKKEIFELLKSENIKENDLYNKITLPFTYFVPGGRFKEAYYWDSYWILIGLLSCNMNEYAFELTQSIAFLIDKFGYMPNGTRQYYLGRSQPPFFSQMLLRLYNANIHREWILEEGLESLEKEYNWWMENRHFDKDFRLNRYKITKINIPRPESFKEDFEFSDKFKELWAGAESGWDFSARWFNGGGKLENISTGDIIPVDLNVYMLITEKIILFLNEKKLEKKEASATFDTSTVINDSEKTINSSAKDPKEEVRKKILLFKNYILEREFAINSILWNQEQKVWLDYNAVTKTHSKAFFFSNITPLFVNIKMPEGNLYDILDMYKKELFSYPGGIPVSNIESAKDENGQQWDFPNVWAPLTQMFVEYMINKDFDVALHVAKSFYRSVYKGLGTNKDFHEKYNCLLVGEKGQGGEYESQEGFGWTNGTVAWMIKIFKNKLTENDDHKKSYEDVCRIISSKKSEDNESVVDI
ncbi:alpha alpha trehalase precursor [Vairimorpha ceranae]|uniref:Trehalase n=1 Tax=Vairimorpha ceranae TaxID=40302 RepID=A0A0F9WEC5_9MICR|nr:alpha alpha trehalase precursor [Vairimorpha ceranae]KAF5140180.1 hypothetical protein G9O61_00g016450 [Vairimorpha ceranae]KKO75145.1 alpha alpha trehalase precursor [Vairimorpha ceranae]